MQTTKKKPSLIFILVGAVLAGYLGYLINGAWTEGIAFNEFMDRFNEVCAVPFANYYNSNTVKAVAIILFLNIIPEPCNRTASHNNQSPFDIHPIASPATSASSITSSVGSCASLLAACIITG